MRCLGLSLTLFQHLAPQDGVYPALVALALRFQPSQHVRVHAGSDLLLDRTVVRGGLHLGQLRLGQFGHVAEVDGVVRLGGQGLQVPALLLSQRGQRVERVANGFPAHSASFPSAWRAGPR